MKFEYKQSWLSAAEMICGMFKYVKIHSIFVEASVMLIEWKCDLGDHVISVCTLIEKTRLSLLLYQRKEIQTNKANKVIPVSAFNLFQAVFGNSGISIFQPYGHIFSDNKLGLEVDTWPKNISALCVPLRSLKVNEHQHRSERDSYVLYISRAPVDIYSNTVKNIGKILRSH